MPETDPFERSCTTVKRVSVIIPHYNDLERLRHCLDRLDRQTAPRSVYDVLVVDNNSRCGLDDVRRVAAASANVILGAEQGAGPARNAGVAASKGEILAFIDSDCVPADDWIENGVLALESGDVIGGRVDVLPEHPGRLSATEAFESVFAFDFERYITKKNFTGSGNMFVTRAVFDAVGGFRKAVSEDVDWSHRAVAAGYRLRYAPTVVIGHPARRNWSELVAKWRRLTRESYLYQRSRGETRLGWVVRAFAVLASPLLHIGSAATSAKLTSPAERLKAIGILFAIRGFRFLEMSRVMLADLRAPGPAGQPRQAGRPE